MHPNSEHHDLNSHIGVVKFTFASLTLGEMVEWYEEHRSWWEAVKGETEQHYADMARRQDSSGQ